MLYLHRQAGAGTLFVRSASGAEVVVHVQNGRPTAARSTEGGADMLQALLPACGFTAGEFAFYSGDLIKAVQAALASAEIVRGALDPYALLYASLRDYARDDMADSVLSRYPTAKLSVPAESDIARLELDEDDQAVVEALRAKPMTLDEIVMSSPLPGLHTRRLIYALLVTHMLAASEVGATDAVPPPPTPSRHAAIDVRRMGERSIAPPQSPDRQAPRVIATKAAAPGAAVPGTVNEVASAAMPAWQRLMSMRPGMPVDPKRSTLDGSLRPPAAMRGSLTGVNVNDPGVKRRRADQFLQTGKFGEALALFDELIAAEPLDAKLHGLRARALFEVHKADSGGLPRAVLEAVRKAHDLDADEANAFFVRGLIFKQSSETQKAIACWKRALLTNPKHLDAEREIRIALMRK